MNEQSTADSAERVALDEPLPALPPGPAVRRGPSVNSIVERAFRVPSAFYARYPGFLTLAVLGFLAAVVMSDLGTIHDWYGGEALPQRALAEELIKGDFPPGGPYAGMPTHLPPLYATIIGGVSRLTGTNPFRLVGLASVLGAVLLPVVAYVTGKVLFHDWRPAAAGAAFVTFGAGFSDLHLGGRLALHKRASLRPAKPARYRPAAHPASRRALRAGGRRGRRPLRAVYRCDRRGANRHQPAVDGVPGHDTDRARRRLGRYAAP